MNLGTMDASFVTGTPRGPQTEAFVLLSVCIFKYLILPLLFNYVLKTLLSKTELRFSVTDFRPGWGWIRAVLQEEDAVTWVARG